MIKVKNLTFGHKGALTSPLSFELGPGEVILINGKNGSGKTTLAKTINGDIALLSGSIERTLKTSYLPQYYTPSLNLALTIGELASLYGVSDKVNSFLLSDIPASLHWSELSGGMKQRMMLALSLARGAEVLILDEPANHLDQKGIEDLCFLLTVLLKEDLIKALIVISHIPLFENAPADLPIKRVSL